MNVLFVIHYPVFGGPHNQALRLAEPLAEHGIRTLVVLPSEPGNAAARLRLGGVEVVQASLHRLRATMNPLTHARYAMSMRSEVAALRRLIREEHIDIVQLAGLVNVHAALAARLESKPIVWQIVDSRLPALARHVLMRVVARHASVLMFTGQRLMRLHMGRAVENRRCLIFYPPVDTTRFVPSNERRQVTRSKLGIPYDATVIGTVANLNPQKGIDYFIRAAGLIWRERHDVWFLLVGAQYETHREYMNRVRGDIVRLDIPTERVIFAGERVDVESYYPAMDVKVISSVPLSEGAPTTALEAMSCGVPVVATDVGSVADVVLDHVTGFVVPPLQPEALARAALVLISDDRLRASMGHAARARVEALFGLPRCIEVHLAAYDLAQSGAIRP